MKKVIAGTITKDERFWLDQQAIQDSFLFEALQGYDYHENQQQNIPALKTLQKVGLSNSFKWAAILIFSLGIALIIPRFFDSTEMEIAQYQPPVHEPVANSVIVAEDDSEAEKVPEEDSQNIPNKRQSTTKMMQPSVALQEMNTEPEKNNKIPPSSIHKNESAKKSVQLEAIVERSIQIVEAKDSIDTPKAFQSPKSDNTAKAPSQSQVIEATKKLMVPKTFKGVVVDGDGIPLAGANILEKDSDNGTITNKQGHFTLFSFDSVVTINAYYAGFMPSLMELKANKPDTIFMASTNMAEIFIEENQKNYIQARPKIGFEAFDQYVEEETKTLPKDKYSGYVKLEFEITKDGNIRNINVIQSSCQPCEKKAKRILKKGGHWENLSKESGLYNHTFKF